MHLPITFIAIVVSIARNAEAGQQCFECHEIPTPQTCSRVTECGEHEECFVESIVTSSGLLLYNVGCMPKERCLVRKRSSDFAKRDELVTCLECCSEGNLCNIQGCGFSYLPQERRGPYCYHCDIQESQQSCLNVVVCGQDEECLLEPNLDFPPKVYYRSKCGDKLTCLAARQIHNNGKPTHNVDELIVGRRFTEYGDCPACCNTDFCNNNCTQNNSVAIHGTIAPVTSFTTTSEPMTTRTTTKPTSTTTPSVLTKATELVTHVHHEHTSTHMPLITHVVQDCSKDGSGYIQTRHLCIKFHFDVMNFKDATTACAREGAILVTIDTKEKMSEIWTELQHLSGHIPDLWIGGSDVNQTDTFYWQTGREVYPYTNWGKIQPQPNDQLYHDQDCIILHRFDNYTWYDEPCYRYYGFICEHPIQAIHTSMAQRQSCESHPRFQLLEHDLGCVEYVRIPTDWDTANYYCRIFESHLVNIGSAEKQQAIFKFLKAHMSGPAQKYHYAVGSREYLLNDWFRNVLVWDNESADSWIGLVSTTMTPHDIHDWRWEAGLPYSYAHWDSNHPDATGNCVIIFTNGYWKNRACNEHHSFVCEKNHF